MRRNAVALFLLFAAFACTSVAPSPVKVSGAQDDLQGLTGEWFGTYESRTTGRHGSIEFHLTADPSGAHGDVLMAPPVSMIRNQRVMLEEPAAETQVIRISFVRVSGSTVTGEMEPYTLGGDNELLTTRFTGTLKGNTIRGTFETVGGNNAAPARGTWRVKRKSS